MIYRVSRYIAQELIVRAKVASCTIKVFMVDADGVYNAKWDSKGVHVYEEVTASDNDYLKLNWFNKPHHTLFITLSQKFGQHLLIGVWGEDHILEKLKDKFLVENKETVHDTSD